MASLVAASYATDPNNRVSPSETFHDRNIIVIIIVIFVLILGVSLGLGLYMAERSKHSESRKRLYSRPAEIAILIAGALAIFLLIILGVFLIFVFPGPMIVRSDEIGRQRQRQEKIENYDVEMVEQINKNPPPPPIVAI